MRLRASGLSRRARREHGRVQAMLPGYLDGEFGSAERAQVMSHTRACDRCRGVLLSPPSVARMLRSVATDPRPGLVDAVLLRLAQEGDMPGAARIPSEDGERDVERTRNGTGVGVATAFMAALQPRQLRRSLPATIVVGGVLTVMYQLGSLLSGHAGVATYAMCACNFAIAFALATVVSALTLIGTSRRRDRNRRGD